jgi:hypothetical protein
MQKAERFARTSFGGGSSRIFCVSRSQVTGGCEVPASTR